VQCAALDGRTSSEVARQVVRECYLGDDRGRAIHLLGPLRGDVIRVAPPLVMPPAEASQYLDAMYAVVARVAKG
jgi:4-aminobutyrate aminotransferase-like enzyme